MAGTAATAVVSADGPPSAIRLAATTNSKPLVMTIGGLKKRSTGTCAWVRTSPLDEAKKSRHLNGRTAKGGGGTSAGGNGPNHDISWDLGKEEGGASAPLQPFGCPGVPSSTGTHVQQRCTSRTRIGTRYVCISHTEGRNGRLLACAPLGRLLACAPLGRL